MSFAFTCLVMLVGTASAQAQIKMVALGHSIFAAQSGPSPTGYPEQLQAALKSKGYDVSMTNAGVWGDATSGVLRRLDKAVPDGTDIVLLAIGSNDMRQGASMASVQADIDAIVARLRAKRAEVIVFFGNEPVTSVQRLPDRTVIPMLWRKLPGDMQALDHPTSAGNAKMVEWTLPVVEEVIVKVRQRR